MSRRYLNLLKIFEDSSLSENHDDSDTEFIQEADDAFKETSQEDTTSENV